MTQLTLLFRRSSARSKLLRASLLANPLLAQYGFKLLQNKKTPEGIFLFWRRDRDSNPG